MGLERIRRDLNDAVQEGLIRHVRLNLLVFLAGANHGDADGVLEVSRCFELAQAVLLRHGLCGLVLIQETQEGGDEPGDAALAQGMVLVDGGGHELHAGELHALEVGVVVLVAVHVQVARQEGGHDGALVQGRVLVVDDLAEELPGVAVADRVGAEGAQRVLEFVVLAQARASTRPATAP